MATKIRLVVTTPRILVTGATGANGSELIRRLSAAGMPVRAMVRTRRGGSMPGVEVVIGDFDQASSLQWALSGIERAFLVSNSSERAETQQLGFVKVARDAGLRHIVYLSRVNADKDSTVRLLRAHGILEDAIASSGMAFTHLRPNLYMQGLLRFRASILSESRFAAPMGAARVSMVDVRDIAAVAARALTEDGHEGKTYDITGPDALTYGEAAAHLTQVLGREILFADIPEASMRATLAAWRMPEWQADGVIEDYAYYRRGEASSVSAAVRDITGVAPRSFLDFARDYRKVFLA
jgi:uncharacterized protein YbjT (DUF2867 family)